MGMIQMVAAITASLRRNNTPLYKKRVEEKPNKPDFTGFVPHTQEWKDKHLEWANAGLCAECGAPSGEYKGICDKCRWE